MSEMSTAYGDAVITVNNKETALKVLKTLQSYVGGEEDIYTNFNYEDALQTVIEDENKFVGKCSVDASGNYDFITNLNHLGRDCKHDQFLTDTPWRIRFDYYDEAVSDFMCHAVVDVIHEENQELSDIKVDLVNCHGYDRNAYTLKKFFDADEDYMKEASYLGEDYRYEFEDEEGYEENRLFRLEMSAKSYIEIENPNASLEEAEAYILKKFPFFEPLPKEAK